MIVYRKSPIGHMNGQVATCDGMEGELVYHIYGFMGIVA